MRISLISFIAVSYAVLSFAAPLAIPADGLSERSYDEELSVFDRRQLEQPVPRDIIPVVERSVDVDSSDLERRQRYSSPPPPYRPETPPPPYSPPRTPPPSYSSSGGGSSRRRG